MNEKLLRRSLRAVGATALAVGLSFSFLAPAEAANQNTTPGNNSADCRIAWSASAVMDADLTNDDPEYPGLMLDREGNPVSDYTNGGFISSVSTELGDPGLMEVQHFYNGRGENLTQVWRIPVATDEAMENLSFTFTLPEEVKDLPVTFDATSTNDRMKLWGPPWDTYQWAERATASDNGDGTWTVNLPDLGAKQATIFQFDVLIGDNFTKNDRFVASAKLSADDASGECGYDDDFTVPEPQPSDDLNVCQVEFSGRTLWNKNDPDITQRDKFYNGTASDQEGVVNADGWFSKDRFMRLYGGTHIELENARYEAEIVHGGTFKSDYPVDLLTPGHVLKDDGYPNEVTGADFSVSEDGTKYSGTIDSMPADSSFSFNAVVVDNDDNPVAVMHRLIGDIPGCDPNQPEDKVETGEWVDTTKDCDAQTVTQTREVTTTSYKFDSETFKWVAQEPVVTTETREREMTEEEIEACSAPTEEPTPSETDEPAPSETATPSTPAAEQTTPAAAGDVADTPESELPKTGAESVLPMVAIGALLLLAGGAALFFARRGRLQ